MMHTDINCQGNFQLLGLPCKPVYSLMLKLKDLADIMSGLNPEQIRLALELILNYNGLFYCPDKLAVGFIAQVLEEDELPPTLGDDVLDMLEVTKSEYTAKINLAQDNLLIEFPEQVSNILDLLLESTWEDLNDLTNFNDIALFLEIYRLIGPLTVSVYWYDSKSEILVVHVS